MVTILIITTFTALCIWIYFLLYLLKSFKQSPTFHFLTNANTNNKPLKISIIIAARNEEKYIEKCLDSLLKQDYANFEIIGVDDSSSDKTFEVMQEYQLINPDKMTVINAGLPPDEWVGKNWACYQGYLNSTGEIFLFTDADTVCSTSTLSIAVEYLSKDKLDALTVRPNIICKSLWSKIVFPVILTFSHVKYSALRVNNDKSKKHGYFFGCFYLITRKTYETIGTHNEVKNEIIEDVALGEKVKQRGYKIRMYGGEHHINTVAAGGFGTILQGLRRSINLIPFSSNDTFSTFLTWFFLVKPFFVFLYSALLLLQVYNSFTEHNLLNQHLLIISLVTISIIILTTVIQSRIGISQSLLYGFTSPLAGLLMSFVFVLLLINRRNTGICSIDWRGRQNVITKVQKLNTLKENKNKT